MAVDRLADDDPEEISGGFREQHEHRQQPANGMSAGTEIAESRTRAEYYQALRATADTAGASAPISLGQCRPAHSSAVRRPSHTAGTGYPYPGWGRDRWRPPVRRRQAWQDRVPRELGRGQNNRQHSECRALARFSHPQRNGRWLIEGVRDQVALAVVIVADGRIWTAYPLPGSPGVRQNPRNQ